jgi:DNA-directed RNA polymerase subunit RPC12/RpoP
LKKSDTVVIKSGQRVSRSLTKVCYQCKNENKRPYYYLQETVSEMNDDSEIVYACEEHTFHCWVCDHDRPLTGSFYEKNQTKRICAPCSVEWQKPDKRSTACLLCSGFNWVGTETKGFDKCPRCHSRSLPKSRPKQEDTGVDKQGLIHAKRPRVYSGKRNGKQYKLVVQGRLFFADHWWLMNNEGKGLATNMDELLVFHINGTSLFSQVKRRARKD